ncbi:septum formation initiator family protein [Streptantibioticus rubrisoli]|uniref:Septum formation initiator family protein n=1 Tax=Streptantibioticus rubrisoli TaxID=1387313 RepID=A0ABT1PJC4_9ACTN|nr:septum formation initiator family protein [Streptantibioticus rubrisoli]MCQ4044385.1 septum formation initiator family protein [Streptantibioticus rubrisoli]
MPADRFSTATRLKALGAQAQARVYRATGRTPRRGRLTGRAALLALTVCALVVALAYPMRQYVAQRSQIADQREQARQARQRVERLQEEKARWADPEYVKAQAREHLHYVMPGETGYTMSGQRERDADQGDSASGTVANRAWYDNLWNGVNSSDASH